MLYALYAWLQTQLTRKTLFRLFILLGLFDVFPLAWQLTVPFLLLYTLYKHEAIARSLYSLEPAKVVEHILASYIYQPANLLRAVLAVTFFSFTSWPVLGFFQIYAVYRLRTQDLITHFSGILQRIEDLPHEQKMYALIGTTLIVGAAIFTGNFSLILDLATWLGSFAVIYAGARAVWGDLKNAWRNLVRIGATHYAKWECALWGRSFAWTVSYNHVEGSLGPAFGHIQQSNPGASILGSFFSPPLRFNFFGNYVGRLWSGMTGNASGLFGGLFSYHVHTTGNFTGVVGPSATSLVGWTVIGLIWGLCLEKLIDKLYDNVEADIHAIEGTAQQKFQAARARLNTTHEQLKRAQQSTRARIGEMQNKAKQTARSGIALVRQARWHLLFMAVCTPLILTSPGGAVLLNWSGGSMAAASMLVISAISALLATLKGVFSATSWIWNRIRQRRNASGPGRNIAQQRQRLTPVADSSVNREELLQPRPSALNQFDAARSATSDSDPASSAAPLSTQEPPDPARRAGSSLQPSI